MPVSLTTASVVSVLVVAVPGATAEPVANVNREPDPVLVEIVDAPPPPDTRLSPDLEWVLLLERESLPSIAELAEAELRLAGWRINPRTNGPSRLRPWSGLKAHVSSPPPESGEGGEPSANQPSNGEYR